MSRETVIAIIAVLVLFGAVQTWINYKLRAVNDDVIGKCVVEPIVQRETTA